MVGHTSPDEADVLRSRRLNHGFLEEVTKDIEKMTLSSQ